MKTINLTTPSASLAYLRSLAPGTLIELPGGPSETASSSAASDAVGVIDGQAAHLFAQQKRQWVWTAREIIDALLYRGNYLGAAVDSGILFATETDPLSDEAFIYYEPSGKAHEHAARYVKIDGVWQNDDDIAGDLWTAIGACEEAERTMLVLLGLNDN
jgi:hypothetical protein